MPAPRLTARSALQPQNRIVPSPERLACSPAADVFWGTLSVCGTRCRHTSFSPWATGGSRMVQWRPLLNRSIPSRHEYRIWTSTRPTTTSGHKSARRSPTTLSRIHDCCDGPTPNLSHDSLESNGRKQRIGVGRNGTAGCGQFPTGPHPFSSLRHRDYPPGAFYAYLRP